MTKTTVPPSLLAQQQQRQQLISVEEQLLTSFEPCYSPLLRAALQQQVSTLRAHTQRVLVTGAINAGKTTTIHAFLGQRVLPADPGPMTALLTEVSWGKHPIAWLHYRPTAHGTPEPLEIPLAALERYLSSVPGEQLRACARIEIFLPHPLLQCGITFVDIPSQFGFASPEDEREMTERIRRYLASAAAVLYVLDSRIPLDPVEERMIAAMRHASKAEMFFLCNRMDQVEAPLQTQHTHLLNLSRLISYQHHHIFFTNAKAALYNRLGGQQELNEMSGFAHVETSLFELLASHTQEQVQAARQVLQYVLVNMSYLEEHKRPLYKLASAGNGGADSHTLHRHLETYPQVEELDRLRLRSSLRFLDFRHALTKELTAIATCFSLNVIEEVDEWVLEYGVMSRQLCAFGDTFDGDEYERLVKGLMTFLAQRFQQEFHHWLERVLCPLLQTKLQTIATLLQAPHTRFFTLLAHLHTTLEGAVSDGEEASQQVEWRMAIWKQLHEMPENILTAVEAACGDAGYAPKLLAHMLDTLAMRPLMLRAHSMQEMQEALGQQFQEHLLTIQKRWAQSIARLVEQALARLQTSLDCQLDLFIDSINTLMQEDIRVRQASDEQERTAGKIEHTIALLQTMYNEVTTNPQI